MTQTSVILIIEDDRAVALSLEDGLREAGYAVRWERTAAAGLTAARSAAPLHLVILDAQLPDGIGFDVCREMRRHGVRVPVLMLTVRAETVDKVLGLEMGADDYVTKPYDWRELLSRVRALIRRAHGEFAAVEGRLDAGGLQIDLNRSTVARGDREILLTPTEFRLLVQLARHPGQVFSRSQLLDTIWGYDASPESEHIVNVYIRRLRAKIETDPARPTLILTVPGLGYRLARE